MYFSYLNQITKTNYTLYIMQNLCKHNSVIENLKFKKILFVKLQLKVLVYLASFTYKALHIFLFRKRNTNSTLKALTLNIITITFFCFVDIVDEREFQ